VNEPTDDLSTKVPVLAGVARPHEARRGRNWRRVGVAILAVIVAVACLGWLGPRDATASAEDGEEKVTVTYPQVTRSGVDSAYEITVDRPAGGAVRLEMPASALDELGLEQIVPTPAAEGVRGDTFHAMFVGLPKGEVTVRVLGRMPTRATLGRFTHTIGVSTGRGEPIEVETRTWVLP